MPNTITELGRTSDRAQTRVQGTIALSGSYVQVSGAGEILDFTKLVSPAGSSFPSSQPPISIDIWGSNGYGYGVIAKPASQQLKVRVCTTATTELSAGAYPAGVTSDYVQFEAVFPTLI